MKHNLQKDPRVTLGLFKLIPLSMLNLIADYFDEETREQIFYFRENKSYCFRWLNDYSYSQIHYFPGPHAEELKDEFREGPTKTIDNVKSHFTNWLNYLLAISNADIQLKKFRSLAPAFNDLYFDSDEAFPKDHIPKLRAKLRLLKDLIDSDSEITSDDKKKAATIIEKAEGGLLGLNRREWRNIFFAEILAVFIDRLPTIAGYINQAFSSMEAEAMFRALMSHP